jgi:hypothetical protein
MSLSSIIYTIQTTHFTSYILTIRDKLNVPYEFEFNYIYYTNHSLYFLYLNNMRHLTSVLNNPTKPCQNTPATKILEL